MYLVPIAHIPLPTPVLMLDVGVPILADRIERVINEPGIGWALIQFASLLHPGTRITEEHLRESTWRWFGRTLAARVEAATMGSTNQ